MKKAFVFFAISIFVGFGFSACSGFSADDGGVKFACADSCDMMVKCGADSDADKCKKNCSADYGDENSLWTCNADCWLNAGSCSDGESCVKYKCDDPENPNPCDSITLPGSCGDGCCDQQGGENSENCWDDCQDAPYYCGDGKCEGIINIYHSETHGSCPADCGLCGDGKCELDENCNDCEDDCACADGQLCNETSFVCEDDPLAEYYWLEGMWKRTEVNGIPDGQIVEVTIDHWDDEKGAMVKNFKPLGGCWIKKNSETSEFSLFVEFDDGNYAEGWAIEATETVEFDSCDAGGTLCSHTVYIKLK